MIKKKLIDILIVIVIAFGVVSCSDAKTQQKIIEEKLNNAVGYLMLGNVSEAKRLLDEAVDENPRYAKSYYIYGLVLERESMYTDGSIKDKEIAKKSLVYLKKAHEYDMENVEYHLYFASKLSDANEHLLAVDEFKKIIPLVENKEVWLKNESYLSALRTYFYSMVRLDAYDAMSEIEGWVEYLKEDPLIMTSYFEAMTHKNSDKAVFELNEYFKKYGYSEAVMEGHCNAYYDLSIYAKSLKCYKSAVRQGKKDRYIKYAEFMIRNIKEKVKQ